MTYAPNHSHSGRSSRSEGQHYHLQLASLIALTAPCICLWALPPNSVRAGTLVNGWTITLPPGASAANPTRIDLSQQRFNLIDSFSSFAPHTYRIQAAANASTDPTTQFFNITFMVANKTGNAPFSGFSINITDINVQNGTKPPSPHIFPDPAAPVHPTQAHIHPTLGNPNDNTFRTVDPNTDFGVISMRVSNGRLAPEAPGATGPTWMRTGRFHDDVVANVETAFSITLTPAGLPTTPVTLAPSRPQGFSISEPDATERTSETIRDFVLLGKVWAAQGDVLLFQPGSGNLSDRIRFVNVANGPGGALTANVFFESDVIDPAQEALIPTLPPNSFTRGFTEDGTERSEMLKLADGSAIKVDIFSDLQDPPNPILLFASDRITFTLSVPEPNAIVLMAIGAVGLALSRRLPRIRS